MAPSTAMLLRADGRFEAVVIAISTNDCACLAAMSRDNMEVLGCRTGMECCQDRIVTLQLFGDDMLTCMQVLSCHVYGHCAHCWRVDVRYVMMGNRPCRTRQHNKQRAVGDEDTRYKILLAIKRYGSTRNPRLPPPNQLTEPHEWLQQLGRRTKGSRAFAVGAECCATVALAAVLPQGDFGAAVMKCYRLPS